MSTRSEGGSNSRTEITQLYCELQEITHAHTCAHTHTPLGEYILRELHLFIVISWQCLDILFVELTTTNTPGILKGHKDLCFCSYVVGSDESRKQFDAAVNQFISSVNQI